MSKPLPNDDTDVDPAELEAVEDETRGEAIAPELTAQNAKLTEWDEPADATGGEVAKVKPDDEVPAAVQFVEEGLDAADRDQRLAAADPDFEP